MKPIETAYKGYRFRSRLEARWAICLDALGWSWEYELEGFDLGGGDLYLPDFALLGGECHQAVQCWIEVKPTEPNADELRKARKLALQSHVPVLFAIGSPDPLSLEGLGGYSEDGEFYLNGLASITRECWVKWRRPGWLMGGESRCEVVDEAACARARSARFERGARA